METGSIPEHIDSKLHRYSERLGISVDELRSRLLEIFNEEKSRRRKIDTAWKISLRRLRGSLRRDLGLDTSPAVMMKGYFFGDTGVLDTLEIRRSIAIRIWENDPERAIREGWTDEEGRVLDPREKILEDGRIIDNPNRGLPLPEDEHSYIRRYYGLSSKMVEDNYKFSILTVFGDQAEEDLVPLYTPVAFRALYDSAPDSKIIQLRASKVTQFREIDEDIDVDSLIYDVYPVYTLSQILELYSLENDTESEERDFTPVLIEADVSRISETVSDFGSRTLSLDDEDLFEIDERGIRCFIRADYPLEFGVDSRVIVVGRVRRFRDEITIQAYGFYPLREYLVV